MTRIFRVVKNSIQTVGGVNVSTGGSANGVYEVNGFTVIDALTNGFLKSLTAGTSTSSPGVIQSYAAGNTSAVFQIIGPAGDVFMTDGLGDLSMYGNLNLTGPSSIYQMGGATMINSFGQFVGNGINVGSYGISSGGYNVAGGYYGQTATANFAAGFTVASVTYHNMVFVGGVLVSYN